MMRNVLLGVLLVIVGCQLPAEQDSYRPLREHGQLPAYEELATRARRQADLANIAFFGNNYGDLEDVTRALEQTAMFLPSAPEAIEGKTEEVRKLSADISKQAGRISASVRQLNQLSPDERERRSREINGLLTSLQNTVRALPRKSP